MRAYYNEIDPKAAAWLRELIKRGLIADGDVDETDIRDVDPARLGGYTQCHFFAGIGGWSLALRLAGWPDDRPVWTGSCPCQPFSAAGRRAGVADERHLWPHWHHLISQCQPAIVFGEQVASKDGLGWLDLVHADMEATGYAVGAADLCAAGIGAPHIRQRLWFVGERLADAADAGLQIGRRGSGREPGSVEQSERLRADGGLADAGSRGSTQGLSEPQQRQEGIAGEHDDNRGQRAGGQAAPAAAWPRPTDGQWAAADWLFCRDGKWRPVEPASQRMANGLSLCLGSVRRARADEKEEVLSVEGRVGLGRKALRVLRESNGPEAFWLSVGGRIGFPQATFLLAILCEYSRELGIVEDGKKTSSAQNGEVFLRTLRRSTPSASCSPQRSECSEQLIRELGDALSKLSQDSAQHQELMNFLASYTAGPLANSAAARVGRLRGYGNAIVPQVAGTFIRSVMEC